MQERFKCFSVKILDYYNITVHSLVCNKLSVSKMHGETIKTIKIIVAQLSVVQGIDFSSTLIYLFLSLTIQCLCPVPLYQDRQCSYNVTSRRVSLTTVAIGKTIILHILSVCLQPQLSGMPSACAVLYCHLWTVRLYRFFPHYLINGTIFEKKLLNTKCVS